MKKTNLEDFADRIRDERASAYLSSQIVKDRNRRHLQGRIAMTFAGTLGLVAMTLVVATPRAALAGMEDAVSTTEREGVIQQTHWRDIRGTLTPKVTSTWAGNKFSREGENILLVDNGKVQATVFKKKGRAYLDLPRSDYEQPPQLKMLLDPRWKWERKEIQFEGAGAIEWNGSGTFRDSGRPLPIDTKVIVEKTHGRIVSYETWRENRTYADFWTYRYPTETKLSFSFDLTDKAVTDVRKVREKFLREVKSGRKGLLMAIADESGLVGLIVRGGPKPDDRRPSKITINGDSKGTSMTYAFGRQEDFFAKVGKDIWFHVAYSPDAVKSGGPNTFVVDSHMAPARRFEKVKVDSVLSVRSFMGRYRK